LHANIAFKDTGELLFPPFCIVKRGGVKVGVLGLGLVRMEHPAARSLSYLDPVGVAAKYVPILREQADLVLVLSHLGHEADVELGSKVRGIDIIVGGHEHEPLLEPLRIPGPSGGKDATLVRSGVYGQWLGRIDLKLLRENGRYAIEDLKWRRIPIDASISEDKKVVKRLKKYAIPLKEVICESKVHLDAPKEGKSPLGNLVAEAVLSATDADVALLDRGTAQGSIQPGPVTLGAVLNVHVFRNGILLLSMTGAEIERAIAENDLYFAGCSFTRTQGGKGCASLAIQGKPVTLDGRYTVAMNDYFQGSTPALRDLAAKPTGIRVDVALADYLREQRVISAEATGAPAAP
jgi:2',3'-cyclic-nucleotide 2'-phosphodiesterase (5'-nucleotidase family)